VAATAARTLRTPTVVGARCVYLTLLPASLAARLQVTSTTWIAAKDRKVTAVAHSLDALLAQLEGSDLQSLIIDRIERPEWMVYR